jgi:peptide/nickel transport system substrate-binding protein
VIRLTALLAAIAVSLLAVSGAGGAGAQTPKRGGTVVVAMNSLAEPACLGWDPICLSGTQWRDKVLALPFRASPYGYRNDLVDRYTLTKVPFRVTFHIRPRARWSDGVPITARDFAFAYRTFRDHSGLDQKDPFRTAIRRVDAVDAKTVRFVFRTQYGDWKRLLQFSPLPQHALRGVSLSKSRDFWKDGIVNPRTGEPIASGPLLVGSVEGGKQVTLIRNPNYWGPHAAYLDRVVLRFVSGPDTQDALRSGQFDLGVLAGQPPGQLSSYPGFRLVTTSWGAWEHFEIRAGPGGNPALRKKLVRRALAFGIDRVGLVRALFGAAPRDRRPVLDNTMYLTTEPSYRPNWAMYRYRPAESRRLLEQAGCSAGSDGIYSCAGQRLSIRFMTTAGAGSFRQRALELVGPQLRRAGFEVLPVYVPAAVLFSPDSPLIAGDFDVALFQYVKPAPEALGSPYRCGSADNVSGYCSRLTTADLNQLDRTVDPARRDAVANRIDRRLAGDVPALPLYQLPLTYVVRDRLHGVVANGFTRTTSEWSVWNAENWWLDR